MTREMFNNEYDYLLNCLKYNYLSIEIDEGYFSHQKYSFKISFNKIKYNNLIILEEYSEEFPRRFRSRDPKRSWKRTFVNDINYLRDFVIFINEIKNLVFYSNKWDYDILDGPSFVLKLTNHIKYYSYLGDGFDLSDSSYERIIERVREFVGKWTKDCFLPWKEEGQNEE